MREKRIFPLIFSSSVSVLIPVSSSASAGSSLHQMNSFLLNGWHRNAGIRDPGGENTGWTRNTYGLMSCGRERVTLPVLCLSLSRPNVPLGFHSTSQSRAWLSLSVAGNKMYLPRKVVTLPEWVSVLINRPKGETWVRPCRRFHPVSQSRPSSCTHYVIWKWKARFWPLTLRLRLSLQWLDTFVTLCLFPLFSLSLSLSPLIWCLWST